MSLYCTQCPWTRFDDDHKKHRNVTHIDRADIPEGSRWLDVLLSVTPGAICITNAEGTVVATNNSFRYLFSLQESDLEGVHFSELVAEQDRAIAESLYKEYMGGNQEAHHEWLYKQNHGERKSFSIRSQKIGCEGGRVYKVSSLLDVTALQLMSEELRQSEMRVRSLMNATDDSTFLLDREGNVLDLNEQAAQRLNKRISQVANKNIAELFSGTVLKNRQKHLESVWRTRRPARFEDERAGLHFNNIMSPLISDNMDIVGVLWNASEITEKKNAEKLLRYQASHDILTGLYNRAYFLDRLDTLLSADKDAANSNWAVIYLDLDSFKYINDTFGHVVGDGVLSEYARRLNMELGDSCLLARLGGDEFALLISTECDPAGIIQGFIERINAALTDPVVVDHKELRASSSKGIVLGNKSYSIGEQVLRDADTAMYKAKARGSGSFAFFNKTMHQEMRKRWQIESDLLLAIDRGDFILHFQPVLECSTGRPVSLEGLVRWQHPDHGIISPMDFIPVAEETGLIINLSQHVIDLACRSTADFKNVSQFRDIRVGINLSAKELVGGDTVRMLQNTIEKYNLESGSLCIEVTESVLVDNHDVAARILRDLQKLKVSIYIDDFGTGYSSLAYLRDLPVDVLKIDRSFVMNLPGSTENAKIVRAIIHLAHDLGLRVVAEGVETKTQMDLLHEWGCDYLQGYYLARPMPADEVVEYLTRHQDNSGQISYVAAG